MLSLCRYPTLCTKFAAGSMGSRAHTRLPMSHASLASVLAALARAGLRMPTPDHAEAEAWGAPASDGDDDCNDSDGDDGDDSDCARLSDFDSSNCDNDAKGGSDGSIHSAAERGDVGAVTRMLEAPLPHSDGSERGIHQLVNDRDDDRFTPLMRAAAGMGDVATARLLVKWGAQVGAK